MSTPRKVDIDYSVRFRSRLVRARPGVSSRLRQSQVLDVMVMLPRDVLAQHLDLMEVLGSGTSPLGRFLDSVAVLDSVVTQHSQLGRVVAQNLANARAYQVTAPMTDLIDKRAEVLHDLSRVGEEFFPPRECGFVVLEKPLVFTEVRGRKEILHALTWGPCLDRNESPGWIVTLFNDISRQPDDVAVLYLDEEVRRFIGRWHVIRSFWLPYGLRAGPQIIEPSEADCRKVEADGDTAYPTRNLGRVILALWATLDETVSTHTSTRGDRAISRLAARRKLPTEISVITLRREAHPVLHPGSGGSPDHRVWVEEFRRRYWVGSGADRRLEWRKVRAHWWPADDALPISDRPRLNRLSR